jgi:hypothetical protein
VHGRRVRGAHQRRPHLGAAAATDFADSPGATACRAAAPNASTEYEVALFYARGTASAGQVTFELGGTTKTRVVRVNAATGRVS